MWFISLVRSLEYILCYFFPLQNSRCLHLYTSIKLKRFLFFFFSLFIYSLALIGLCSLATMRERIRFFALWVLFFIFFVEKKIPNKCKPFRLTLTIPFKSWWRKKCEWSYASKANRHKQMCERANAKKNRNTYDSYFQLNCLYKYIS